MHLVKAENALTTYSTPGRASVSNSIIVEDMNYDGFKDHSQLTRTGGLWMLTDGEYGLTNIKVNSISLEGNVFIDLESKRAQVFKPFQAAVSS